jgi:hypothetical protein
MQPITVLIVGQVRNQHVLLHSVGNLVALQNAGIVNRVILSTWSEELVKIRHLLPRLSAAGVMVVAAEQPDPQWFVPGHLMNQMRGLDLALETVPDDAWVLRARPDLLIDYEMVAALAAADMALDPAGAPGALGHKIWAPFVEFCTPMCVSDIVFFGHYSDIVKLQNFDFFHEVADTHLGTAPGFKAIASYDAEVRRYTPAFCGAYPVLAEYHRLYNRFFLGVHELRRSMLTMLFREEFYWQYSAAYLDALRKYFLIGGDVVSTPIRLVRPNDFDQTEWLGAINIVGGEYAGEVIAQAPSAAATLDLFVEAPIYCRTSAEVRSLSHHLGCVGLPLERALNDALAFSKDAARILALRAFQERLIVAINGGIERGRAKAPAWEHPFPTYFVTLPKLEDVP